VILLMPDALVRHGIACWAQRRAGGRHA